MVSSLYPPGPKGKLLLRNFLAFRRDPLNFLIHLARDYGDIAHMKLGPWHFYMLNHPDCIKDVLETHHQNFCIGERRGLKYLFGGGLLTSEGDAHRRQRRLIQPAFHLQRIASYGAVMTDYAVQMRERWCENTTLDIAREMRHLTLAIVGKTLFGANIEAEPEKVREALATIVELHGSIRTPLAALLQKFPLPVIRRFKKARDCLDALVYRMINERRANGLNQNDLLSMLLHAQETDSDGGDLTDLQLRDEVATFLVVGHETTANALTWTWYLLSQHPGVEAKLHAELDLVLGDKLPTVDSLKHLQYTQMVFAEALRLYPPIWVIARQALNDCEIGGYFIPAKSTLFISPYVMHHDSRYFPDPFHFDPQRWILATKAEQPQFSYFPFSAGPRVCIGGRFASMEGVLLLATLAQRWRMRLVPGHPVESQPLITLRPKYGMRMILERRKSLSAP